MPIDYHVRRPKHGTLEVGTPAPLVGSDVTPDPSALFRLSLDMICVTTLTGRVVKMNPAFQQTLGWTPKELSGRVTLVDFVHEADREKTREALGKLSGGGELVAFQNRLQSKSGAFKTLDWRANVDPEKRLVYAVARDITHMVDPPTLETTYATLAQKLDAIERTQTRLPLKPPPLIEDVSDEELLAGAKVGKRWLKVALLVAGGACSIVAVIFGAGAAWTEWRGRVATKGDIEEHVMPIRERVEVIEGDLNPVKDGVAQLVATENKERELKKLRRRLEKHDKEYQEALQEYTADKAAGRRTGPRPRKTTEHLELEEQLESLEKQLE